MGLFLIVYLINKRGCATNELGELQGVDYELIEEGYFQVAK